MMMQNFTGSSSILFLFQKFELCSAARNINCGINIAWDNLPEKRKDFFSAQSTPSK